MQQVGDGVADKNGLVKNNLGHKRFWDIYERSETFPDPVNNRYRVRIPALLEHWEVNGALTVDADNVRLHLRGILGGSHVPHQN